MTAHCRPLMVSALALMLPACLHFDNTPYNPPPEPIAKSEANQKSDPSRSTQFASLLSHPGSVVFTKPNSNGPPSPKSEDSEPDTTGGVVAAESTNSAGGS